MSLQSDKFYIYKKENGITYAKLKDSPDQWQEIGRDYPDDLMEETTNWYQILYDAHYDPELKREIERIKIMYYLKKNGTQT